MRHAVFALTAICLVASATGCRMCAHPFDYCGPTFSGGNCQACDPYARAGSILSPPLDTVASNQAVEQGEIISEQAPAAMPAPLETPIETSSPPPDVTSQKPLVMPTSPRRASVRYRSTWR